MSLCPDCMELVCECASDAPPMLGFVDTVPIDVSHTGLSDCHGCGRFAHASSMEQFNLDDCDTGRVIRVNLCIGCASDVKSQVRMRVASVDRSKLVDNIVARAHAKLNEIAMVQKRKEERARLIQQYEREREMV